MGTGWQVMEEMQLQTDNWYACVVVLGESRCERFHLCLDRDTRREIYPAVDNASEMIWPCGPDGQRNDRNWIIDGRDEELSAGTPYGVRFKWGNVRKLLIWDRAPNELAKLVVPYRHVYSVIGSWTSFHFQDMTPSRDEEGMWECSLRIGPKGYEEFQFVHDHDMKQVIYPARPNAVRTTVPARGPDELGQNKHWQLRGPSGDLVTLRLRVVDGKVTVRMISYTKGTKVWESRQGWNRRAYFLARSPSGTFNDWTFTPMAADPVRPGLFKAIGIVSTDFDVLAGGFLAFFQIVIDEDFSCCYYPEMNGASSGDCIAYGPDSRGHGKYFLAQTQYESGRPFEGCLDLTAMDRRQIVTWNWATADIKRDG